ncbi:MAG: transcriptional regulator [Planctomycetes bacterium]|nr:transcriptional regulator [Planctomycetota bacterium]
MSDFGRYFKERRAALGLSLRAFCLRFGLDPSNISKMERGRLPPPQGEKLREYAGCLGLREGSDEWYQFFDLAAAERGIIPDDLRDEELAAKLPVLFRTLRDHAKDGGRDTEELLDELKRKIRGA